jgi:CHAT domain-containing protein
VADGALQYLPFAALPDPAPNTRRVGAVLPLIAKHEIISLPSISVLAQLRNESSRHKAASKLVAVVADPVFSSDDERVKASSVQTSNPPKSGRLAAKHKRTRSRGVAREATHLVRLPESRREAESIVAFAPADKIRKALDFDANRDLVSSGELAEYRYVHFATHGMIDSFRPELSAIVLSLVDKDGKAQDGFLRTNEVYNLSLLSDVVVLSACETALGREVKGEGLIGLTRGFMYAGAPRVVASLWSVRDASTAELMGNFYRGMIKEGKRPAEALRAAQIEMLTKSRWRAPRFWAPFVLQGEWK